MSEVSFDTLEALDRIPVSSVAGTQVSGYHRWVTVHGPIKIEWNLYQQGASDAFAASDTFLSGLARPICAEAQFVNVDNQEGATVSVTLEGVESESTFRTLTVLDADGVNGSGLLVKVIGY